LRADETVLDAGCGEGRVTQLLLERLPRGHVVAVDASPAMVEHAREVLGERATVLQADLAELRLDEPVDAAFSNAVFHWVLDHERLFARLYDALRPDGRLVAQCGGAGNVERFLRTLDRVALRAPFAEPLAGFRRPWNFASPEATAERLRTAGFDEVSTWLDPAPTTPDEPLAFLRTVCLGHHLELLAPDLHDRFVQAVAEEAGEPLEIDYVRLNIDAVRSSP